MRLADRHDLRPLSLGRQHVIAAVAITAVTLLALSAQGRPWWCACGSPVPWSSDINGAHNSQHFLDPYTVSHFEHGLLFFAALLLLPGVALAWRFVGAIALECAWELLENSSFIIDRYRAATISSDYYGDSVLNSLSDVIFAGLGFLVAWQIAKRAKLGWPAWWAVVIACELGLILAVRDSLMINVIMLVHPIDAIRAWQSAS
ncbi:MAG: DUF2585 family protein [Myxococcota bacterium]|nr:DUF2585 family protein [Myxococcota bacterium]